MKIIKKLYCFITVILAGIGKLFASLIELMSVQVEKNKLQVLNQQEEKKQLMVKKKYDYFQYGIISDLFAVLFIHKYPSLDINSIEEIRPVESPDPTHFVYRLPVAGAIREFQLQELKSDMQKDIYRFQQKLLQEYGADAAALYPYIINGLYVTDLRLSSPDFFRITLTANVIY